MRRAARGMALIQALVIVAAIAAVSMALLMRAEGARHRQELRNQAAQVALYLDAGVTLVRLQLAALSEGGSVDRGQTWAQERRDRAIDAGTLSWRVDDLAGRFNLNAVSDEAGTGGDTPRAALVRLARAQGVSAVGAERLADALSPDLPIRAAAAAPRLPPVLPVLHPQQVRYLLADEQPAFDRLLPLLAAVPAETPLNVNTLRPEVLEALAPHWPASLRAALIAAARDTPFARAEDWQAWIAALDDDAAAMVGALGLATSSEWFELQLEARLDSLALRRSVVLDMGAAQGRGAVFLSMSEPE